MAVIPVPTPHRNVKNSNQKSIVCSASRSVWSSPSAGGTRHFFPEPSKPPSTSEWWWSSSPPGAAVAGACLFLLFPTSESVSRTWFAKNIWSSRGGCGGVTMLGTSSMMTHCSGCSTLMLSSSPFSRFSKMGWWVVAVGSPPSWSSPFCWSSSSNSGILILSPCDCCAAEDQFLMYLEYKSWMGTTSGATRNSSRTPAKSLLANDEMMKNFPTKVNVNR